MATLLRRLKNKTDKTVNDTVDVIATAPPMSTVRREREQRDEKDKKLLSDDAVLRSQVLGVRAVTGETGGLEHTQAPQTQGMFERNKRVRRAGGSSSFSFDRLDKVASEILANQDDGEDNDVLDVTSLSKQERKLLEEAMGDTIDIYPHLMALKPTERYIMHSDYFDIDNHVACIMAFFHDETAGESLPAFWGINRIPGNLPAGVSAVVLEQISRETDSWVDDHLDKADKVMKLEEREMKDGSTTMSQDRAFTNVGRGLEGVAGDLLDGDSYLRVHNRLLIKAPTLELLDETVTSIKNKYVDLFTTLNVAPYHGEQLQELSGLLRSNKDKRGKGFHFPSRQYAGSYSLLTNGLNDPGGEYVGQMFGDVNNSAVLFDVDAYKERVVGADDTEVPKMAAALGLPHVRQVDLWGTKIAQSALLNNKRVVHLVLNGANVAKLGTNLDDISTTVDMSGGEVNMFEVFGDVEDEVSLFSVHLNKLTLMTQMLYGKHDQNEAIIFGQLREILTDFYIEQRMWAHNAKDNRDKLRLVNLDHTEVPRLEVFATYVDEKYRLESSHSNDPEVISALSALKFIFNDALDANGDLFNQHTNQGIDRVNAARRIIYEFSSLLRRGGGTDARGVAMAQLVNIVGFAVESLGKGDTVIIHGADAIEDRRVQAYMESQFSYLRRRGGRVVYLYDSPDAMVANQHFNKYHRADYTVLGPMDADTLAAYTAGIGETVPPELAALVHNREFALSYVRRGVMNIVFQTDLPIGLTDSQKYKQRYDATSFDGVSDRAPGFSSRFGSFGRGKQPLSDVDVRSVDDN